jgi:hypothetical protein
MSIIASVLWIYAAWLMFRLKEPPSHIHVPKIGYDCNCDCDYMEEGIYLERNGGGDHDMGDSMDKQFDFMDYNNNGTISNHDCNGSDMEEYPHDVKLGKHSSSSSQGSNTEYTEAETEVGTITDDNIPGVHASPVTVDLLPALGEGCRSELAESDYNNALLMQDIEVDLKKQMVVPISPLRHRGHDGTCSNGKQSSRSFGDCDHDDDVVETEDADVLETIQLQHIRTSTNSLLLGVGRLSELSESHDPLSLLHPLSQDENESLTLELTLSSADSETDIRDTSIGNGSNDFISGQVILPALEEISVHDSQGLENIESNQIARRHGSELECHLSTLDTIELEGESNAHDHSSLLHHLFVRNDNDEEMVAVSDIADGSSESHDLLSFLHPLSQDENESLTLESTLSAADSSESNSRVAEDDIAVSTHPYASSQVGRGVLPAPEEANIHGIQGLENNEINQISPSIRHGSAIECQLPTLDAIE